MKRIAIVSGVVLLVAGLYVADQAVRTLRALDDVEHQRDTWQRPDDVIQHLAVRSGHSVVDLGSGAGYFALKIAPRVAPDGLVLAVDLRRQSLAFLWVRAWRRGYSNLHVIRGDVNDPRLPPGPIDAALIVNTFHELTNSAAILQALFRSMRSGGRLVVVDRGPHREGRPHPREIHRAITLDEAEHEITRQGFQTVVKDDQFIDRAEDDPWWLLAARKP